MTVLLIAVWVAGIASLLGTRYVITFFQRLGRGQPILGKEDRGPEHQHKAGTPTMGGIAIVGAAFLGWLVPHMSRGLPFSDQALAVWFAVFVLAFIGFLDDFIKVRRARNRGIFWKAKGWITLFVCILLVAILVLVVNDFATTINLTRADLPGWELPKVLFVIWGGFIVFATANAVNVTDGLDGLAAGTSMMGFAAYALIAFWGFRNQEVFPAIVNPLDLAVLAAAFAGALAGFLWWNAAPAKVFMGDVGALGIGAAMGMLALTTNTTLLLPIIAGVQVIEILSVAIQMTSYKLFHRRVFRLSPIHHHFELIGWPETRIIIRFWLISALFVGTAVAIYYADWYRVARSLGLIP